MPTFLKDVRLESLTYVFAFRALISARNRIAQADSSPGASSTTQR